MANATALFGVVPEHRKDSIESAQVTSVFWLLFWLLARSLFTCVFWYWSPLVYLHSHEIPFKSPQLLNRDTFQLLTQMPFNFPFSV